MVDRPKADKIRKLLTALESIELLIENISKQPDKQDMLYFGSVEVGKIKRDTLVEMLTEKAEDLNTKMGRE